MKRALWVTAIAPCFDGGGGGEIRQAHLIGALAERFEVSLLLAGRLEDQEVRACLKSVREVNVGLAADPVDRWRRRFRDLSWLVVQRRSDEVARHARIRRALAPLIADDSHPEIVCVEYIGLAQLLPRERRGFWALTLHNLTSVMASHNAAITPGRRQRMMLELERNNARRVEHWAARAYDLVAVPSADDAASLPVAAAVVPNGVDATRFHVTPLPEEARVIFTGALHTLPNRDGICWFCEHVWPQVRGRCPTARLDIVGARPPKEVRALSDRDGIEVHADVPDVVPFLARARVAVVPVRIGTGSRLKALEAMAAGRPVVGTSIGLGGIEAQDGREVIAADRPEDLAQAVARCLTDDDLVAGLTARARRLVEQHYDWKHIGAGYASLLDARSEA